VIKIGKVKTYQLLEKREVYKLIKRINDSNCVCLVRKNRRRKEKKELENYIG